MGDSQPPNPQPFKACDPKNVAVEQKNLALLTKEDEDEDGDEDGDEDEDEVAVVVVVVSFVLHSIARLHAHCPTNQHHDHNTNLGRIHPGGAKRNAKGKEVHILHKYFQGTTLRG